MSLEDEGPQAGFEAQLYLKISTNWTQITQAQDVSAPDANTEIEASCKGSGDKGYISGMADRSIEFDYLWLKGVTDPVFAALQEAKEDRTHVEVASADGDITVDGTKYVRDWYVVTELSKNEELDNAVTYSVKLRPTLHFNAGVRVPRSAVEVSAP